ncbi:MAG: peptidylprolyl isomerase [Acidobacteriota bacterium]|nr:peptidylprolyl isomerase [Acidobacteriota bacterium]
MNRLFLILFIFAALLFSFACDENTSSKTNSNSTAEIKKGVAPVADAEIAVIEMENSAAFGTIKIELYSNIAPKMVARFKELAKEGVYNGVSFHRINQSVIQSGDPNSKDNNPNNDGQGNSDKPNVPAEFSDILYDTGIVGAARGTSNDSANSQFFITLKRESGFDNRYTIFGKVIEGMGNVKTIAGTPTDKTNPNPGLKERPLDDVRIKQITIQPR